MGKAVNQLEATAAAAAAGFRAGGGEEDPILEQWAASKAKGLLFAIKNLKKKENCRNENR